MPPHPHLANSIQFVTGYVIYKRIRVSKELGCFEKERADNWFIILT